VNYLRRHSYARLVSKVGIIRDDRIFRPPKCSCAASFGVNRIISELGSMQMWRTKSQDARGGKAIPADFTRDVMLNKILGLSDFTIALSSSRPSTTSYTTGALLRSFWSCPACGHRWSASCPLPRAAPRDGLNLGAGHERMLSPQSLLSPLR
jgi:hypothetical protein